MSRLIDADELIKYIKIWEIGTSISSDQKEFLMWIRLLANWKEINSLNQNVFYLMCIKDTMLD